MARWVERVFPTLPLSLILFAGPAAAQCPISALECEPDTPRWVGEFTALSANALLGGLTAGTTRLLRGGSFRDGFVDGLLGGSAVYAGKRVAAERFDGAGLIGRTVAAAGTSMVVSAGDGADLFSRFLLPVGPVLLDVRPGHGVRARLDAIAAGWMIYGVAEPELTLDPGRSLSAGAVVFRTDGKLVARDEDAHAAGLMSAGVIFLADIPAYGDAVLERAFAHERIHVLQQDFIAAAWTDPVVDGLMAKTTPTRTLSQYVRVNVATELMRALGLFVSDYEERPWEIEAIFFAR